MSSAGGSKKPKPPPRSGEHRRRPCPKFSALSRRCSACSGRTTRSAWCFMPSTAASQPAMLVNVGHPVGERRLADVARVGDRGARLVHRREDQLDLAGLEHVDDVRPSVGDLVDHAHRHATGGGRRCRCPRGDDLEAERVQIAGDSDGARLVAVLHGDARTVPSVRQARSRSSWLLSIASPKLRPRPSPRRWSASRGRGSGRRRELVERGTPPLLDRGVGMISRGASRRRRAARRAAGRPCSAPRSSPADWPVAFETNGTVRDARGLTSRT